MIIICNPFYNKFLLFRYLPSSLLYFLGTLDVPDGTTLRTHLSCILNCDPMRITKKFTGDSCIGKRIFQPLCIVEENECKDEIKIIVNLKKRVVVKKR